MGLSERQSELVDTHETVHGEGLPYVLVGGWAVSVFQTQFDRIERHLHRGDSERLAGQMENVLERLEDENFEDSFKGVFEQGSLPEADVGAVTDFLKSQLDKL